MIHEMKLHVRPFEMIARGTKRFELRLMDEKRQKIHLHDTIIFTCSDDPQMHLEVKVIGLHRFPDFETLYSSLPLNECGYLPEEMGSASASDMLEYYSIEEQVKYGVLAIEVQLLT